MSPGQAHKLDLSHDIDGYIYLFTAEFYLVNHINKNRLLELPFFFTLSQNTPLLYIKEKKDKDFIENLFKRGCEEIKERDENREEILRSILDLMLLTCNNLYSTTSSNKRINRGHILVKNFLKLLEENYTKNLRIKDYANMLAITSNHLTETVRVSTGKTPIEFIQDKMTIEIKRLLLHTNLSISEIADKLHFSDLSYFTKFFKKNTGVTPLKFRKNNL